MCGITGFVDTGKAAVPLDVIDKMTAALKHRGPDAHCVFHDEKLPVHLGHARLAIIDLTPTGLQPMHGASERFTIVFNGEIYNHLELREQLGTELSLSWRGTSDTETLLACLAHWGLEKTLHALHGMFAFALLDRDNHTITLARDRFGEKPLYYQVNSAGLCFASELCSMLEHPATNRSPNPRAVQELLTYQAIQAPTTMLTDVHQLLPGTWLTYSLDDGSVATDRWWSVEACRTAGVSQPFQGSTEDALNQLEAILGEAVHRQLISDVPIGAFLSGGIDSSLIVALMQSKSAQPVNTFSIGVEDPAFDEAKAAKKVAEVLGTNHVEAYVSNDDVVSMAHSLGETSNEPMADRSLLPTMLVSKMAREYVTVALTGDAGDEVFGGYNRHVFARNTWPRVRMVPAALRQGIVAGIRHIPEAPFNYVATRMPVTKHWTRPHEMLHDAGHTLSSRNIDELYQNAVTKCQYPLTHNIGELPVSSPQAHLIEAIDSNKYKDASADWIMMMDQANFLSHDVLAKVDRSSMLSSLETRVPFLDQSVVEFAWSLPPEMRINGKQGKWILSQLLYRHVPRALVDRPKQGFSVPLHKLLRNQLADWVNDLLSEPELAKSSFFDSKAVQTAWRNHQSGDKNNINQLWPLLAYQAWQQHWLR